MNPTDPSTVATIATTGAATGAAALSGATDPVTWMLVVFIGPVVGLFVWVVRELVSSRIATIETLQKALDSMAAEHAARRESDRSAREAREMVLRSIAERNRLALREHLDWRSSQAGRRNITPSGAEGALSVSQGAITRELQRYELEDDNG